MSTQMQASRLQILDIIRGVAIFAVVAVHVDQIATKIVVDTGIEFNETAITSTLAPYGRYGVELFFVLSGFLMSMIYYKRSSESQINVRKFLSRRARRIYPLWIAFFIIGIIESYVVGFGGWKDSISSLTNDYSFVESALITIFATITFTLFLFPELWNSTLAGGWSIQSEVANYMLFIIFGRRSTLFLFSGMFFVSITQAIMNHFTSNEDSFVLNALNRLNPGSSFFFFCSGVLINHIVQNKSMLIQWAKNNFFAIGIYVLAAIVQYFLDPVFGKTLDAIKTLFFFALFIAIINKTRLLRNIFAKIGKFSYFVYFAHFHILWLYYYLVRDSNGNLRVGIYEFLGVREIIFLITFLITLGTSSLLGALSYKYFENPFLRKKI